MGEVKTCFHCGTNFERAIAIAERRNGDTNDLMDASQEAQQYDWLDQQNEKIKAENTRLREALEYAKNAMNEIIEHNPIMQIGSAIANIEEAIKEQVK